VSSRGMADLRGLRRRTPEAVLASMVVFLLVGPGLISGTASGARGSPTPSFPPFSINATATPSSGPVPVSVAFSSQASGGLAPYYYNWSFGDGSANATDPSVNHTYRWVAVFHVNVTAVDVLGEIATKTLTVDATPAPLTVALSANPSALASGATTYLETSVQGGVPPYRYAWTGLPVGCPGQSVENLSCTPTYGGSYVVNVTVNDSSGRSASAVIGLVVSGPPPPTRAPSMGSPASNYPFEILAVVLLGAAAIAAAAVIGRRARKRRDDPGG
jgi:PKD repeat protein